MASFVWDVNPEHSIANLLEREKKRLDDDREDAGVEKMGALHPVERWIYFFQHGHNFFSFM